MGHKSVEGVISVFLVIILVPCLAIASLFVDLGRVHMAKGVAESSADLALNTLLTQYDADLEEWYGMVASCQSISEFYTVSAEYFLKALASQGLSDDDIILISDYYKNVTSDDTIHDLLQMTCKTDSSSMITAVADADLTNATVIKKEIVEFMKYRAPIEITADIIERFQEDTSLDGALQAKENEPLVESKSTYYETEGELLSAAFNTYVALYDYYRETIQSDGLSNQKLSDMTDKLNAYKTAYEEMHRLAVFNLINTAGLSVYTRATVSLTKYTYSKTDTEEIHSQKKTVDGEEQYYIDGSAITTLLDALEDAIQAFHTAKEQIISDGSSLMGKLPGTGDTDSYAVQWWYQMDQAINASSGTNDTAEMKNAGDTLIKAYARAMAIQDCELGEEIPEGWETRFQTLTEEAKSIQETYLTAGIADSTDDYLKMMQKMEQVSQDNAEKLTAAGLSVTVDGQVMSLQSAPAYISGQLAAMKAYLQNYIDLLNTVIDGNEDDSSVSENDKVKSLDELLTLAESYHTSFSNWQNTAQNTDTDMGEKDRGEIDSLEENFDVDQINEEAVRELKTRLSNIRSQVQSVMDGIDSMKYGNQAVWRIDSYQAFYSEITSVVQASEIGLTNGSLRSYSASTFSQMFSPTTENVMTLQHLNESAYNPKIDPSSGEIDTPALFVYLHRRFKGISKQSVDEKKDELDGGKDKANEEAKNAKNKNRNSDTVSATNITKDFSADGSFNLGLSALTGVIGFVEDIVNGDLANIRDDIYVTSYIMNMFSYATYEHEGLYGLLGEEDQRSLKVSTYETVYDEKVKGSSDTEKGKWLSASVTDSYNKTLTNKSINSGNNTAYCAEVEYILYGGENASNVKALYSDIYGIRYSLNLVSGFAHFYSGNNTTAAAINTIANSIAIATGEIIPAPLTKVILIPILTIFETSKDMDRLEAGFPVELYKSDAADWWVSLPGTNYSSVSAFINAFSSDKTNTDKGLYYSDYITLFVYLGLTNENTAEAMYQRIAEVIQSNIDKKNGDASFSMKNAQVYFKLEAELQVKPLMLGTWVFDDYSNNLDSATGWCTFKVSAVRGYQ